MSYQALGQIFGDFYEQKRRQTVSRTQLHTRVPLLLPQMTLCDPLGLFNVFVS